jgi:2-dehydro-3-deoxy-L-rhamnonate dehydrogenase (NAD+)
MLRQKRGRIINIASIAGKEGNPNMSAYSAAKGAVIAFTKSVAKEVAKEGVLVHSVAPAVIETELLSQVTPEEVKYMLDRVPMGRFGKPEEVSALVTFLASGRLTFSTGACFDLSGGRAVY